jgi:hypothetical protein
MKIKRTMGLIFLILYSLCVASIAFSKTDLAAIGDRDMTKYKSFLVVSSRLPNTPEFFREIPVIQNLTYHLINEGYSLVNKLEDADFIATTLFYDDIKQEYVPPVTFATTTYNPGTTTTSMSGMFLGTGNFINFSGTTRSQSTGSATTTAFTAGGYYVPRYGVSIIVNIYDVKTQELKWSGAGSSTAKQTDLLPYVNSILSDLIREKLMTPAYINNTRKKGKGFVKKELFTNEYLKPIRDKEYFMPTVNGVSINGADYVVSIKLEGQTLNCMLSVKNNTDRPISVDPSQLSIAADGKTGYIFKKSELLNILFKSGEVDIVESRKNEWGGFMGGLFSPIGDMLGTSAKSKEENRDKQVRFYNNAYIDFKSVEPNEAYAGTFYAILPFYLLGNEQADINVTMEGESQTVSFIYEKGWMTVEEYNKWLKKNYSK